MTLRLVLASLLLLAPAARAQEDDDGEAEPMMMRMKGLVLFYDTAGPMSFLTMTPKDLPAGSVGMGEVTGRSCQRGLAIPLGLGPRSQSVSAYKGNGSYEKALERIRKDNPGLAGIFDVKVDRRTFSILGIYHSLCTEITARGFR
jgi:hypothetical protein